jgi:CDGSH iron-sulfur domain-containing protein 3
MARIIINENKGPLKVQIEGETKFICQCGLSNNMPFCNGKHKTTHDEEEGKIYKYNEDGTREEIKE